MKREREKKTCEGERWWYYRGRIRGEGVEKREVRGRRVWRIRKVIIGKRESEGGVVSVCRRWRRGFVHSLILILFLAVLYEREISMALKLSWFLWKLRSFIESIFWIEREEREKGWWRKKRSVGLWHRYRGGQERECDSPHLLLLLA